MRHRQRTERRREGAPTVIESRTAATTVVAIYLWSGGRGGAIGSASDPFASWGAVVDRLRMLYAMGVRRIVVRVMSISLRLSNAERKAIRQLEAQGLSARFEVPELAPAPVVAEGPPCPSCGTRLAAIAPEGMSLRCPSCGFLIRPSAGRAS